MSGQDYVIAAYTVTGGGLVGLVLVTLLRAAHWARRARELEKRRARELEKK